MGSQVPDLTTERNFVCELRGSLMYLAYSLDMLSMYACTIRHWQTSSRLVQELNVCMYFNLFRLSYSYHKSPGIQNNCISCTILVPASGNLLNGDIYDPFHIGESNTWEAPPYNLFDGTIYGVRLSNFIRTETEIRDHFMQVMITNLLEIEYET